MNKPCLLSYFSMIILVIMSQAFMPVFSQAKTTEVKTENFDLNEDGQVVISNISGDITVTTWSKAQVQMTATKIARSKEDLDKVTYKIRRSEKKLRIETEYETEGANHVSVNYELIIPDKAALEVETISGDVTATGLGGQIEIETISGDIKIAQSGNTIDSSVISGDVSIMDGKGNAEISSISGDVLITNLIGSIAVSSVSGDIILKNISQSEKIKTEAVSGTIQYEGDAHPNGYYSFDCHSGTIKLILKPDANFEIQGETFSGSIQSDFELGTDDQKIGKEFKARIGTGGAQFEVSTFSGDISLSTIK
ncbi:DUF4097 family beta strand repeat protein [bacterium]|nr:DUF4097 family beta strand repeat protein [bacterium]